MATNMTEDQLRVYEAVNQPAPVLPNKFNHTAHKTARWLIESVGTLIGRGTGSARYYVYDGQVYFVNSTTQAQWCGNVFEFADDVVKGMETTHYDFRKAGTFPFGHEEEREEYKGK